jgi:hypothetical protein
MIYVPSSASQEKVKREDTDIIEIIEDDTTELRGSYCQRCRG